jgi:phosphatidylinositol alpha-1,6-mannosyltransferase
MARITLVSRNFPPLSGGMERLVHQLYGGLTENHEVSLLGPSGCEDFVVSGSRVKSTSVSPTPIFLLLTLVKGVFARISTGAADIVMGGSGLVGPVVIFLAKISGGKSILLLHGLDIIADSRIYQWVFVPFLKHADLVICNSKNTARLAVEHGVEERSIVIVNPGVDMNVASTPHDLAKHQMDLQGKTVLLSVGRLMPRKGLAEFVEYCFVNLAAADKDLVLLVAGSEPSNALNRPKESVLARIEAAIAKQGVSEQVKILGHANDDDLAVLYAAADAFVFPLIEMRGDVEGFGMVAVEAAVHGTPTVAFDCGGVADAVAEGVNGTLVTAGDYASFGDAITRVVQGDLRDSASKFASQFSWDNYCAQVEQGIARVLK